MTDKLKPCPFCGGEAKCFEPLKRRYGVWCVQCFSGTAYMLQRKKAITVWNRRTTVAGNPVTLFDAKTCTNATCPYYSFSADVVDSVLTVYFEDKESIGRKINFCPMCGRKLGGGEHE